jgi:hypothetical protein
VCVEKVDDQAVERFWSFQVGQVTGIRKDVMSGVGNSATHETMYGEARVVMLADNQ